MEKTQPEPVEMFPRDAEMQQRITQLEHDNRRLESQLALIAGNDPVTLQELLATCELENRQRRRYWAQVTSALRETRPTHDPEWIAVKVAALQLVEFNPTGDGSPHGPYKDAGVKPL